MRSSGRITSGKDTHGTTAATTVWPLASALHRPDGKRHSTTDTSARKVQTRAAQELSRLIEDHATQEAKSATLTRFDLFAEEWLQTRRPGQPGGYKPIVYRKRLLHLRALNESFGRRFIEEIRVADIRAWWNTRADKPVQRVNLYALLHMIFEVAMDDELIQRNPCRVRGASAVASKRRPTFTDADVQKIYDAAEDPQMRAIILILMGTALRIGELSALDWENVELLDGKIDVVQHWTPLGIEEGTKTGPEQTRTIALPLWVREVLEGLYARSDGEGAVFRNQRGGRLSVDSAERRFRPIREKAGLPSMHLHDLRHVALTNYARLPGVTLAEVMAFGGHRSERVAMRYQHSDGERAQLHAAASVAPRWVKA